MCYPRIVQIVVYILIQPETPSDSVEYDAPEAEAVNAAEEKPAAETTPAADATTAPEKPAVPAK